MGYLRAIWDEFQSVKQFTQLDEEGIPDIHKALMVFLNAVATQDAMEIFDFSHCAMDQGEEELYAAINISGDSDPNVILPFTKSDLNELKISVDEYKGQLVEAPYRSFLDRLEIVIDKAVTEMNSHEKTAKWVIERNRYGMPQSTEDKKPLQSVKYAL